MWPDNETAEDLLGFQVHADLIRSVVTDPKMLPTIIGVFGDWGGGKTSIMKMLQQDLDPEHWSEGSKERAVCEKTAVVYVNTWQFEGYDDSKSAVLSAVLLQLAEHKRFGPKVRDTAGSLLKSIDWMRVVRLGLKHVVVPGVAAYLTGGMSAIPATLALAAGFTQSAADKKSDEHAAKKEDAKEEKLPWDELVKKEAASSATLDVRTFRSRFEGMLKDSDIESLVVLVDDLDRCTPERIVDNLEAIKLFLNVEHTAFVIGADPRIVEHAIRARYAERALNDPQQKEESDRLVKDYLEKVVQIPYHLPRLSAAEIETYMVLLFCKRHLSGEQAATCMATCENSRARNRYSTFGYAAVREALGNTDLDKDLAEALALSAAAAPLMADGLKGNPRQVKRFLNALLLRKALAKVAQLENIRDDVLVKLMILEYTDDRLFAELFAWQATQDGHPRELAVLEGTMVKKAQVGEEEPSIPPNWTTSATRKWLSMEPKLAGVDLRDYFWVARDKLATTFSGITMVPPAVRTVLDGLLSDKKPRRNTAIQTALRLTTDERASLFTLIKQQITRRPEEKSGYDALGFLAEHLIPGSAEALVDVLTTRPLEKMPRTVGMDLMNLLKAKPQLSTILQPAVGRLSQSNTPIAAAMKAGQKG